MERAVALRKLKRLLGKTMGYRFDPAAPVKDQREEARLKLKELRVEHEAIRKKRDKRLMEVLAADAEYQQVLEEDRTATEQEARLQEFANWYRVMVGKSNGAFFVIEAQGDSWEEVIAKVSAKEKV